MQSKLPPSLGRPFDFGIAQSRRPNGVNDLIFWPMATMRAKRRQRSAPCAGCDQVRRVRIARPPRDLDFNDMLMGRAACVDTSAP